MIQPNFSSGSPVQFLSNLIREHAELLQDQPALRDDAQVLSYLQLDRAMDRIAATIQQAGLRRGEVIAICAMNSVRYACIFLGALRAGLVVAPLAPSSSPDSLVSMLRDAQVRLLFWDSAAPEIEEFAGIQRISLDGDTDGIPFDEWLCPEGTQPQSVDIEPDAAFNIIYSSGTTGVPKGIVQSHAMRWAHICRGAKYEYGPAATTLLATPLYSNTTLVVFFPTLALGGCVVLMTKFDAAQYLVLAERYRVTHAMLVPVQYQRILSVPSFEHHDLSSFRFKFCTSAPFGAALKSNVLRRWPGNLVEFYGMTEGGGTCILDMRLHPDKLHTVGKPADGHDIRLIDEHENEVVPGESGEVVGNSPGMMTGYFKKPELTKEAEWLDAQGKRFIRTGDVGRFDSDGFLVLIDRRKDMIISGGFNIYPSDLESLLRGHPAVSEVAVVGVDSMQWGETPVAFVVLRAGQSVLSFDLKIWCNQRVGKTQRLSDLCFVDELPRSSIGKILKRELRDAYRNRSLISTRT
ncbi:acyl--CoA ligase [Acidovorax sp. D2M1]|uniref:Acyl--CoA ligase n=1 Tax=Acidovorax benzenivorans TaxID=2987520 RepID=A0ABT5S3W0_9BURK|nr:class I adenylate-forming enzyme family protein [Acidovorax benzenivorans]MDD2180646.1 acyl--CoA ligase [Acidovorax benzenivorans]